MNKEDRDIDALLRASVERQLASFDWEGLGRGIDKRVTTAGARFRSWIQYGRWGAIAAGIALTAGVLIFAMTSATGPGSAGEAKVAMIESAYATGTAQVSFKPAEEPVRCEVTILPSGRPREQDRTRASWCIIAKQELSTG